MYILAKDESGQTLRRSIVKDEAEAWDMATATLACRTEIKRVAFFSPQFVFVNGLTKPEHFKAGQPDDTISEEDKQACLTLESL